MIGSRYSGFNENPVSNEQLDRDNKFNYRWALFGMSLNFFVVFLIGFIVYECLQLSQASRIFFLVMSGATFVTTLIMLIVCIVTRRKYKKAE